MKQIFKVFLSSLLALTLTALPAMGAQTNVFVSIMPQKYFVEQIGKDLVNVDVLVMPGANPHMYEPSPKQMTQLSKAKAYFSIGITLEETWIPRIKSANSALQVFETDHGITKIAMVAHHHEEHGENHEAHEHEHAIHEHSEEHEHAMHGHAEEHGHHEHKGLDPHVWLSPARVKIIASNICAGLVEIDPANKLAYERNLAAFIREIEKTDKAIADKLAMVPKNRRSFLVFHPSWGYFADQYGLTQITIEEEGNEPSPKHLAEIIEHGQELDIHVVFVQPQFSRKNAQVIADELGAQVLPLDPLAEDWKKNLLDATDAFVDALR